MEKLIVADIIEFCNKYGKAIKIHGSQFMEVGTPDILGSIRVQNGPAGYVIIPFLCETKMPNRHPTKIQNHRMAEWNSAGILSFCAHSLEEFKTMIKTVRKDYTTYMTTACIRPVWKCDE